MPKDTDNLEDEILEEEQLEDQEPDTVVEEESDDDSPSKLADMESSYKHLQGAYTKSQQNVKALERQLAELSGKIDVITTMNQQSQGDWLDEIGGEEAPEEAVRGDPALTLKAMKRMRAEIYKLLESRDEYILKEVKKSRPIDADLRDKVNELKEDPDFEGMDNQTLAKLAKKLIDKKKVVRKPAGSPGGKKTHKEKPAKNIEETDMWKKMYDGYFTEDK